MQSGAAILTSAWSSTTSNAYSAGLDTRVREWDLERGESRVLGRHDAAVGSLVWCPETSERATSLQITNQSYSSFL